MALDAALAVKVQSVGENEGLPGPFRRTCLGVKFRGFASFGPRHRGAVPRFFFLVCPFATRHSVEELSWVKRLS